MSDYNDGILLRPCLRMDTHFGDEYESIEFGDGTGYIKAAPILAKVGALHEEIDRLRDESAELRERIKELEECIRGDAEGIYRLAKNTGYMHTDELMESIHNRMRELGIEVNG